jgi:hypothetical protein
MNGSTGKNGLEALLPSRQKVTCKRTRPIVQPVVLKRAALGPDLNSKGARGFCNLFRDFRVQNVAIFVKRDKTPSKLSAAPPELKLSLGQVLIK